MSLCSSVGARATLRLCSLAAWRPLSTAALLPTRRLHLCWRSAGRINSFEASTLQPQPQQRRQQQRQRRPASSAVADPAPAHADHAQQQQLQQQHPTHTASQQQQAPAALAPQQQQQQQQQHGAIEIVVGPMFAGKTTELLRRVASYEAAGLSVAVVKSQKDDRYCTANVVTHDGLKRPCFAATSLAAFKEAAGEAYSGFHVIAVDEAQFFPDLHDFCTHAADHDHKRFILAGLDGDFQRQRFGQVVDLLPMADSVTKLTAHCKFCAQEDRRVSAVFSLRISADSRQELVGGADVYAPVCRRHYVQLSAVRQPADEPGSGGAEAAA